MKKGTRLLIAQLGVLAALATFPTKYEASGVYEGVNDSIDRGGLFNRPTARFDLGDKVSEFPASTKELSELKGSRRYDIKGYECLLAKYSANYSQSD